MLTLGIAAFYPSGTPADESMSLGFGATYGWIASQAVFLAVPGVMFGMIASIWLPRLGTVAGSAFVAVVPVVTLCDVVTFNWIAERFLSATLVQIVTTLLPGLILHVTGAMVLYAEVMPNLHAYAQESVYCPHNFSSGNATCLGMFGMVSGLEANWFHRPVNKRPLLNRAFRQAGYRVGFFGGHTEWRQYDMNGFVQSIHFDDFQVEEPELPDSDLRVVRRATQFVDQGRKSTQGRAEAGPSMAIAYMFGTHSRYSAPEDQIFQPAAPVNAILPRTPETIERFINRFKNSMRAMDGMLKPLLRDDCVVVVVGDHGEPFFEDGTAAHGTRLSRYQNMTPAIIHYPGVTPRQIEAPTFHADVLPTLLSIANIPLTEPESLDGIDILSASSDELERRTFLTCSFMDKTSLLVGPWTLDPKRPFGYRIVFDIHDWKSHYLNPIDDAGYRWSGDDDSGETCFRGWVVERFGQDALETSGSRRELFERFFASSDPRTRLMATRIAANVSRPQDYLYQLIGRACHDPDEDVRRAAKELII